MRYNLDFEQKSSQIRYEIINQKDEGIKASESNSRISLTADSSGNIVEIQVSQTET